MRIVRSAAFLGALALAVTVVASAPAGAAAPTVVSRAETWLASQQQADGGFEVAGFPGFETPDAVLALAENGQSGTWNTTTALSAVTSVTKGGKNALDSLDAFVDAGIDAGQAAKIVVLDVEPLGLDPTDFDPAANSASAVDLKAMILATAGPDGNYPSLSAAFNSQLYVALALPLLGQTVPAGLVNLIKGAQQANGSWNYSGSSTGTDFDPDTTGVAVEALVAAGLPTSDAVIVKAMKAMADQQQPDGAWQSFGADDPNSTAVAIGAIRAVGGDPASSCWRNAADNTLAPTSYSDPLGWLDAQQAADGHISSPNDGFGVNTFATTQAVQALAGGWLPVASASPIGCAAAPTPTDANQRYVEAAYRDVLSRNADSSGVTYLSGKLGSGSPRSVVPQVLTSSGEYRSQVIADWFHQFLGTAPGSGDQASGHTLLKAGRDADAEAAILGSPAFYAQSGSTTAGFLGAVYTDVLHRTIDANGQAAWTASLTHGASRASVAKAIVSTSEARGAQIRALYVHYLHRQGDASGVNYFRGLLAKGVPVESGIRSLVGSNEYFARVAGA